MPLFKPDPPAPSTFAFRDGLRAFLAGPNFGEAGQLVSQADLTADTPPSESDFSPPGGPWDHDPQQVFSLGLLDLKKGTGVTTARLVAWRYFAGDASGKVVLGTVIQRPASGDWKLASVFYGYRVLRALVESREIAQLDEVQAANYELRVLRIPGLNLEAFWLVAINAPVDLVAVFPAPPNQLIPQLNVSRVLTMTAFLGIVVPLATQRLTFPASTGS